MIPFAYVFKELFAERTRILLTVLAIAWGTAAITIMLALGEGLRLTFGRAIKGTGEGILVVWPGQTSKAYDGHSEGRRLSLDPEDLRLVRAAIPQIASISGEYERWTQMRHGNRWRTGQLRGVEPDYGPMRNVLPAPGGRFISPLDEIQRRRVAVIGPQVVQELFGPGVDPVGQTMEIGGRPFLIVGVMAQKFQTASYGPPDRVGTWIPDQVYRTMYGSRYYSDWVIRPRRPEDMARVKSRLLELFARRHECDPEDPDILRFWDTQKMQATSAGVFYGLQSLLGIIGALTLVVAGVGIANVMFISVKNATRDIGIRMAVGARDSQVLFQYILEGLLVTALGGLLGLAVSEAVVAGVGAIPMKGKFFEFVGRPVPVLSLDVALVVILILGLVGFLAGLFPARRAARIDPAEALRYE